MAGEPQTTTPNLVMSEIHDAQSAKHITHNDALRTLDSLVQAVIIDRDLTAPPGSPSDGDNYIVGASATGDWSTHDDEIAYYKSSAWEFNVPAEGWLVYAQDENELLIYNGSAWVTLVTILEADAHDTDGALEGLPTSSQVVGRFLFARAVTFPDDFAGSKGDVDTAPTDSAGADFDIKKNGSSIGTMSFASAATVATFTTSGGATSMAIADVLTVVAPGSADPALANLSFVFKGTRD